MNNEVSVGERPTDAVTETRAMMRWMTIRDDMLRGVAHSMSNRVAALSAGIWMIGETGNSSSETVAALHEEVERLELLMQQLRMLPQSEDIQEPLIASDSAQTAIALHEHHVELRNISCEIDDPGTVAPAHAEPQALLHALIVALTTAKQSAGRDGQVVLRLRTEDDVVRFIATIRDEVEIDFSDAPFALEARAASQLLESSGGTARAHRHGCVVDVPTLASVRLKSR